MLATLKQWLSKESRVLFTTFSVAGIVLVLRFLGLLQASELAFLDLFFRLRPLEPPDDRVTIVGITEGDLQQFGHPISDEYLSLLLEKLNDYQPLAIGLDIYRDLPKEPGSEQLTRTFQTIPNIIGIEKLETNGSGVRPSPILKSLNQVGFNNVVNDADGQVRRVLLYFHDDENKFYESFALKLALIYLEKSKITPEKSTENPAYLQLNQAVFRLLKPDDGSYIKVDNKGYQFLANLRGPAGTFKEVSMSQVLAGEVDTNLIENKIVLIGSTAESLKDFQLTSYSYHLLKPPERMTGVELQAHFISQIISAAVNGRKLIQVWPDPLEWLWILCGSWLGSLISWKLQSPRDSIATILLVSIGLIGVCFVTFIAVGLWIPVFPPLLSLVGSSIAIIGYFAHLQEEFKRSKEFLQTVINTIPDPIFVKDIQHRRIVLNRAYCEFIGYPLNLLMTKTDYDLFPQNEADIFWEQDEQVFTTGQQSENEEKFTDSQGQTHLIATKRTLHKDAAGNLFLVGVIRDITERKMMEEQLKHIAAELERSNAELRLSEDLLRYQAHHDTLTGLPNRKLFQERLSQSLEWAINNQKSVGLLFLDLDGFKTINDTLGHNIGDLLLKGVAERLRGCLRGSDTVSRLGGDEFTVILPGIPGKTDAARVAEKIRDTISPMFEIEGHRLIVTTSTGISIYPEDAQDMETLIKNADVAMYRAKELGKNRYEFI